MTVYSSLLNTIPIPQQQWKTPVDVPPVASVKVGNVVSEDTFDKSVQTEKPALGFFERLKQKLVERRMKKLESIPAEQRTPVQQAEYEANKRELDLNS